MNYTFTLLDAASTTDSLPQNLAAVAASTSASLWVPVVIVAGIAVGFTVLNWVIAKFRAGKK